MDSVFFRDLHFSHNPPPTEHLDYIDIYSCVFEHCVSEKGGAVRIDSKERSNAYIRFSKVFFCNCSSTKVGGAVYVYLRNWTFIDCCVSGCKSEESSAVFAVCIKVLSYFNRTSILKNGANNYQNSITMQLQSNDIEMNECNFTYNTIGGPGVCGGFGTMNKLLLSSLTIVNNKGSSGIHTDSKQGECIIEDVNCINNTGFGGWVGFCHVSSPTDITRWIIYGVPLPLFISETISGSGVFTDCVFDISDSTKAFIGKFTSAHLKMKKPDSTLSIAYPDQNKCTNFIRNNDVIDGTNAKSDKMRFILIVTFVSGIIITVVVLFKGSHRTINQDEKETLTGLKRRKAVIPIQRAI